MWWRTSSPPLWGSRPAVSVGEQMPWAVRRLLEEMAGARPLILVIDDVHWADTPLLDLIDYLVDWLRAPVMLLCLARPELLEVRPGWGGGHTRVSSIVLGPLDDGSALRLLDQRLGERQMSVGSARSDSRDRRGQSAVRRATAPDERRGPRLGSQPGDPGCDSKPAFGAARSVGPGRTRVHRARRGDRPRVLVHGGARAPARPRPEPRRTSTCGRWSAAG